VTVVRAGFAMSTSAADGPAHLSDAAMHQGSDDAEQHSPAHAGLRREAAARRRNGQARRVTQ